MRRRLMAMACLASLSVVGCGETRGGTFTNIGDKTVCIMEPDSTKPECFKLSPDADIGAVVGDKVVLRFTDHGVVDISRVSD